MVTITSWGGRIDYYQKVNVLIQYPGGWSSGRWREKDEGSNDKILNKYNPAWCWGNWASETRLVWCRDRIGISYQELETNSILWAVITDLPILQGTRLGLAGYNSNIAKTARQRWALLKTRTIHAHFQYYSSCQTEAEVHYFTTLINPRHLSLSP